MSIGLKADSGGTSGAVQIAGVDKVVITSAGDVSATTFTGNLIGNSSSATKLSTASGAAPSYSVRAWFAFDPTRDSSGATNYNNTARFLYGSGNVTSVVKTTTPLNFSVTFTVSLPTADYCVVSGVGRGDDSVSSSFFNLFIERSGISTATYVAPTVNGFIFNVGGNITTTNTKYISFAVIG